MAHRTVLLVFATAMALLVVSSSLQSSYAVAGSFDAEIQQIHAIEAAAEADIDAIVAPVDSRLRGVTTVDEAKAIRDGAIDELDLTFDTAKAAMWAIVEGTSRQPAVEDAYKVDKSKLETKRALAEDNVKARYDEWKFRYDAPPAEEVIGKMGEELASGLAKIDDVIAGYLDDLAHADTVEDADKKRAEAHGDLAGKVADTRADIDHEFEKRFFDPAVQESRAAMRATLDSTDAAAASTIEAEYRAWLEIRFPPTTTTSTTIRATTTTSTTVRPTTTTVAQVTTTTMRQSTTSTTPAPSTTTSTSTTTVPGVGSGGPPMIMTDMAFLPDAANPAAVVLSATASVQEPGDEDADMAMVGFVRRVVDNRLPAGVAAVAAGPLVVFGLIIDAVRAAGALMIVPWLLLGVYMLGLLRGNRLARTP